MLDGTKDKVEQVACEGGVWGDWTIYAELCYHPIEIAPNEDKTVSHWREVTTKLRRRSAEHQASNT